MLSLKDGLIYPKIVHLYDLDLKHLPRSVYRLDWSAQETAKKHMPPPYDSIDGRVTPSLSEYDGNSERAQQWLPALPPRYDNFVKGLTFAINPKYFSEIRRMATMSHMEWTMERPFDTMIRDICLRPAIEYIFTAFRLLSDCVVDLGRQRWYRGNDAILIPYAMAYKFWRNQTGYGLVMDHAMIPELQHRLPWLSESTRMEVEEFLKVLEEHQELIAIRHDKLYPKPTQELEVGPAK